MLSKKYLNEVKQFQKIAGILKEDDSFDLSYNPLSDNKVGRVVNNYKKEFIEAIEQRIKNPEDFDAYETLKTILKNIGTELGYDPDTPWMEEEYFSGAYSAKEAYEYLVDMLEDDLLSEGKQVGVLYHFTGYCSMLQIIESGMTMYSEAERISFTRYKNFQGPDIEKQVRIAVDGNKLSNSYKIKPYSSTTAPFNRSTHSSKEEAEEFLDIGEGDLDLTNYLISIDIIDINYLDRSDNSKYFSTKDSNIKKCYRSLLREMENNQINYRIVNKFNV